MKRDANDHYHIYTVQLTPGSDGKFEIHQKTGGDHGRHQPDLRPGRPHRVRHEPDVHGDGHARRRVRALARGAAARDHQRRPAATPTGTSSRRTSRTRSRRSSATTARIGFSQWEHFASTQRREALRGVNPDGTQQVDRAIAGPARQAGQRALHRQGDRAERDGRHRHRARPHHPRRRARPDRRAQPRTTPSAWTTRRTNGGVTAATRASTRRTPASRCSRRTFRRGSDPSPVGRYREPSVLPDGRILTSWADGPVNDLNEQSLTPPDFGIYVYDPATGQNQLVYNDRSYLGPQRRRRRRRAPSRRSSATLQHAPTRPIPVRIGSVNVAETSLNEVVSGRAVQQHAARRRPCSRARSRSASSRASRARPPRA